MEYFSQVFGFLTVFKESFTLLITKNGKFIASITLLSLLLPSILLLLIIHIYKTLTNSILKTLDNSNSTSYLPIITYTSLLFLFQIISLTIFIIISHISAIATILVSATSYTDTNISSQHLYSRIQTATKQKVLTLRLRTTSSNPKPTPKGSSSSIMLTLATLVWILFYFLAIFYRDLISIFFVVVVGIPVFGLHVHASVAKMLSHVVSIVEEKYEGSEALERAEELVEGQKHHGFMINMLFLIIFVGSWILGFVNVTEFWLVLVNLFSLAKMFVCVAYTVLYFRCKKYHGEEIGFVGNFDYSKLVDSNLDGNMFLEGRPMLIT